MKYVLIITSIIVALIRIFVPPSAMDFVVVGHLTLVDIYKSMVHIFVGSLIPPMWWGGTLSVTGTNPWDWHWEKDRTYRYLFWGLCAVEVTMAIWTGAK